MNRFTEMKVNSWRLKERKSGAKRDDSRIELP